MKDLSTKLYKMMLGLLHNCDACGVLHTLIFYHRLTGKPIFLGCMT